MKTVHLIVKTLIVSSLIGAGILVFAGSPEGPYFFLDTGSLAFVVLGGAAMTLMGFSFPEIGAAFKHAFGSKDEQKGLEKSIYFWEAAGRNAFMVGVLGSVAGFLIMVENIRSLKDPGLSLTICFITTLYGLILGALCTMTALRVGKKLDSPQQSQAREVPAAQENSLKIENIIGCILFIMIIGGGLIKTDAWSIIIHWPSLLFVAGGAILMVLWTGNGGDGSSFTLGFAFTGLIGVVFGMTQMFYGLPNIKSIANGITFAILSFVFGLLGMMLGGIPLQDRTIKTGKIRQKLALSRAAWYGFPAMAFAFLFLALLIILIPVKKG